MDRRQLQSEVLIFATDDSARAVADRIQARHIGVAVVMDHPGELMRRAVQRRPELLVVCLTLTPSPASRRLVEHFARHSMGVSIVGVAAVHDGTIERSARGLGITHYIALDVPADVEQFDRLLMRFNLPPPAIGPPGRCRTSPAYRHSASSFP